MASALASLVAFLLDLIATFLNQASFAIQKLSHMDEEKQKRTGASAEQTVQRNVFCTLKGAISLLFVIVASVGHFLALPFCDLTLIACNSSSAILLNVAISVKWLNEKFVAKYDIPAMALVFFGTLLIVLLSNKAQQTFTVERILASLTNFGSLVYFALAVALMVAIRSLLPKLLADLR